MEKESRCEQPKICAKEFESIHNSMSQQAAYFEDKIKAIHHRLNDLKDIPTILAELKIIAKQQVDDSVRRDKLVEEQNRTMIEMGKTLIVVTEEMKDTNGEIGSIKKEIKDLTEKVAGISDESKISLLKIGKDILMYAIMAIIGAVIALVIKKG